MTKQNNLNLSQQELTEIVRGIEDKIRRKIDADPAFAKTFREYVKALNDHISDGRLRHLMREMNLTEADVVNSRGLQLNLIEKLKSMSIDNIKDGLPNKFGGVYGS